MCITQGHNTVPPIRLKSTTPPFQVEHPYAESLRSSSEAGIKFNLKIAIRLPLPIKL